jgi:hypothetical protein
LLLILITAVWDATGVLPRSTLQKGFEYAQANEEDIEDVSATVRFMCKDFKNEFVVSDRTCKHLGDNVLNMRRNVEGLRTQLNATRFLSDVFSKGTIILSTILLLLSSFVFGRLWYRFYPMHLHPRPEDLEGIRRVYLLTMATTMFIPNCFAAAIFLLMDVAGRFDIDFLLALSGWVIAAAALPAMVCGILGSYRINAILLNHSHWRVGKTWAIFLISNLATSFLFSSSMVLLGFLMAG